MARLIKNTQKAVLGIRLTTVMETEASVKEFKIGDIIEGLRYVVDGDVGQNFAVHFDAGVLQAVHESGVIHAADLEQTAAARHIGNRHDGQRIGHRCIPKL